MRLKYMLNNRFNTLKQKYLIYIKLQLLTLLKLDT